MSSSSTPGSFLSYADVTALAPKRRRRHDTSQVRVTRRYVAVPLEGWQKLGNPSRVRVLFRDWDVYLVPHDDEDDTVLVDRTSPQFIRLHGNTRHTGWSRLLCRGRYPYSIVRIERVVPALKIQGCCVNPINVQYLQSWQEALGRLERP